MDIPDEIFFQRMDGVKSATERPPALTELYNDNAWVYSINGRQGDMTDYSRLSQRHRLTYVTEGTRR